MIDEYKKLKKDILIKGIESYHSQKKLDNTKAKYIPNQTLLSKESKFLFTGRILDPILLKFIPNVEEYYLSDDIKQNLFSQKNTYLNPIIPKQKSIIQENFERKNRRSVDSLVDRKIKRSINQPELNLIQQANSEIKFNFKKTRKNYQHSTIIGNFRTKCNHKISDLVENCKTNLEKNTENQILQIEKMMKLVLFN